MSRLLYNFDYMGMQWTQYHIRKDKSEQWLDESISWKRFFGSEGLYWPLKDTTYSNIWYFCAPMLMKLSLFFQFWSDGELKIFLEKQNSIASKNYLSLTKLIEYVMRISYEIDFNVLYSFVRL